VNRDRTVDALRSAIFAGEHFKAGYSTAIVKEYSSVYCLEIPDTRRNPVENRSGPLITTTPTEISPAEKRAEQHQAERDGQ